MSAFQTLGKHEIRRQLGRGAMGIVYEGWDPIIKRQVAIKTVRLPVADDEETAGEIARFRREAEAAGRLNHPNIVGVFDYGETDDLAYIVMEFVDGPTVKALLDQHEQFPLPKIERIMEDLLSGLQFSHERGVVHRDVKPANLMLTKSGQAKIADFGIARLESSSMTQTGTVIGTPAYMSPEQLMGEVVDARSDIYSSGVLLYQLLTGQRPFEGSMTTIMQKALNTEPPPPSRISATVPRPLDAVVKRAMAKRPADRYSSAKDFAAAIREAIAVPAPVPKPDLPQPEDGATIIAAPRSPTPPRAATPRPEPAPAPAIPARPAVVAAGADATSPRKRAIGARGVIGTAAVGLAVLGGIAYFVPSSSLVAPVPSREQAGPPVASVPKATMPAIVTADAPVVGPGQPPAPAPPEPATHPPTDPPPNDSPKTEAVPPPASLALREAPPAQVAPAPASPVVASPIVTEPAVAPPAVTSPPGAPAPAPLLAEPPPSPVPLSPLERTRLAASFVPCAALNVTGEQDGPRISGLAGSGPDLDRLLTEARVAGRVTDDIARLDPYGCAPVEAISRLARRSWESAPPTIALDLDRRGLAVISGTTLFIGVATALPIVYIDFYSSDGSVHHVWRPGPSGAANNPHSAAGGAAPRSPRLVAPGPGSGLIVAIGSGRPLDLGTRPEIENSAAYLAVLRPRLDNATPPPVADLAIVTVRPAEPVVPKPRQQEPAAANSHITEPPVAKVRPAEPAVAKLPSPRPAALRSGRCSNILSRAQLGETLSDAEITALRTECRS